MCKRVFIGKTARDTRWQRERGLAAAEVLLLTVPLCFVSLVATSKLAAMASAKTQAVWQSGVAAQTAARSPDGCGINTVYTAAPVIEAVFSENSSLMASSALVQLPGLAILKTGDVAKSAHVKVPGYYFQRSAQKLLASRSDRKEFESSTQYICNEPRNEPKEIIGGRTKRELPYLAWFTGLGLWQAGMMYHGGGGGSGMPKFDPNGQMPEVPGSNGVLPPGMSPGDVAQKGGDAVTKKEQDERERKERK